MRKAFLTALCTICAWSPILAENNWVTNLPDTYLVRQLSIPGAHDAATSSAAAGTAQSKTISEQWDCGIRAFDLRPSYVSDKLTIYHGSFSTSVTFDSALSTLRSKLEANPNEFAFISMRHENDSNESWADAVSTLLSNYDDIIVPFSSALTLADVRGKIIIISRDTFTSSKVGFVSGWGDNRTSESATIACGSNSAILYVQDVYEPGDKDTKNSAITATLDYSTQNPCNTTWVINHTSGYYGGIVTGGNESIKNNAKTANAAMLSYLNEGVTGRTGIVLMDYAGNDTFSGQKLIDAIIAQNDKQADATTSNMLSFFRNSANWTKGSAAANAPGTTTSFYQTTVIESYRDDAFAQGNVMSADCDNVPNGTYMVTVVAHANWTPDRGSIKTAVAAEGAVGYTQLSINGSAVDLPLIHSTSMPSPTNTYLVPVTVTDRHMKISIDNIRKGANWLTCFVQDIQPLATNATVSTQDFEAGRITWATSTGAQNNQLLSNSNAITGTSYENWVSDKVNLKGDMYSTLNVPNGEYEVSLDVYSNVVSGSSVQVFANDNAENVDNAATNETHTLSVTVTDNKLTFGLRFNDAIANWAKVDNAVIKLISSDNSISNNQLFCNPAYYFDNPANWELKASLQKADVGTPGAKDNLYVESWLHTNENITGTVISSTQPGFANGEYLVGAYILSRYTGSETTHEDGTTGLASIKVNNTTVDLPTYNSGSIPSFHELYYIPTEVTDGSLTISFIGNGYPNWFVIDVVDVVATSSDQECELYYPKTVNTDYAHGQYIFTYDTSTTIQNHQILTNTSKSSEQFYEIWNSTAYTGNLYTRVYLPIGVYKFSLNCFAENIDNHLNDYYLFAGDSKAYKTQANAFETLSTEYAVIPADNAAVTPVEFGLGISNAATKWCAVQNPQITKLTTKANAIDNVIVDHEQTTDERVFNTLGICIGNGIDALNSAAPGVYIYRGHKYLRR
jgi:hypothetical protein